jgi:NADH-quinone oxidoreductase subunit M
VLIGIYSGNEVALQGVVIQMIAHGISAGALFILCGELYERLHTRDLRLMGGLWARLKFLPPIALFFAAASLGLPGLGNFVGEFLILLGTFKVAPIVAVVAASGLILAAVYSLVIMQRAFYGAPKSEEKLEDLSARELCMMLTLVALLVWLGLYPQTVLNTSAEAMALVHQQYLQASQQLAPTAANLVP